MYINIVAVIYKYKKITTKLQSDTSNIALRRNQWKILALIIRVKMKMTS